MYPYFIIIILFFFFFPGKLKYLPSYFFSCMVFLKNVLLLFFFNLIIFFFKIIARYYILSNNPLHSRGDSGAVPHKAGRKCFGHHSYLTIYFNIFLSQIIRPLVKVKKICLTYWCPEPLEHPFTRDGNGK